MRRPQPCRRPDHCLAGLGRCGQNLARARPCSSTVGSGGVGHFAIQIAKARGARVIATASTANQEFLKKLGVDQAIDYTATKFEDVVKDVDIVLDAVGGDTLRRSYGVVKKGGIIVTIADESDQAALDAHGIRGVSISAAPKSETFTELTRSDRSRQSKAGRDSGVTAGGGCQGPGTNRHPPHARENYPARGAGAEVMTRSDRSRAETESG